MGTAEVPLEMLVWSVNYRK